MKELSPSFVALSKESKSHIEETDIYTVKK